jgi:hypothetical protein
MPKSITSVQQFQSTYYYKEDLVSFCQDNKIPYLGLMKTQLEENIVAFLDNKKLPFQPKKQTVKWTQDKLGLQEEVTDNFKCNPATRKFFESIIGPKFHFCLALIHYKKSHPNQKVIYQDLVNCWYEEQENRKQGKSSTEKYTKGNRYNKFMQQFYADTKNKGKTHKEMIAEWEILKKSGKVNQL